MRSAGISESHSVASTKAQNAAFQSLLSVIITIWQHHIGHCTDRLGCNGDASGNHRDRSVSDGHHGAGLKGEDEAGRGDPFEREAEHREWEIF